MGDRKPEQTRKVSFAAEHQVNYIYHEECNSTKTSSSMSETPMDLTTDIPEFKSPHLFRNADDEFLNENIENLFLTKDVEEYKEDPILMREYAKRRQSICRKNSLDPLREASMIQERNCPAGDETLGGGESRVERVCNENPGNLSSALETNIPPAGRKSVDGSFNDTAISNSSYVVEELVNTVDLKTMIPYKKKEKREINEYLASIGIRFLDDSIADGMRRDTLSKSRNEIDPSLYYHYKYSIKERIDYLYNFSGFLSDKMAELQEAISDVQKEIDVEGLNKDLLKKIRNESRNKSKIDWYSLRKLNELQFNKRITANRTRIQEIFSIKQRDDERLESEMNERSGNIGVLRARHDEIHRRLLQNNPEELQEAEKLQQMIADRRNLLESVKMEYDLVSKRMGSIKMEEEHLDSSIQALKEGNEVLRNNLMIKNISESALEEIKKGFQRFCTVFKLKILKLAKNSVFVSIYSNEVLLSLNSAFEVTGCTVSIRDHDPFFELVDGGLKTTDFVCCLRSIVGRFIFLQALKNEVETLKDKTRVECFYVNKLLHMRFYSGVNKKIIDLTVDSRFDLIFKNTVVCNVYDSLGSLGVFVTREINAEK